MKMTKQEQLTAIAKWFNDGGVWDASKELDLAYWAAGKLLAVTGVGFCNSSYYPYGEYDGWYTFTRPEVEAEQERLKVEDCDGSWFLTAGSECVYYVSDRLAFEVEITAVTDIGLCFVEKGTNNEHYVSKNAELHRFKPAKTDCDKWVEHAKGLLGFDDEDEQFLRQLYNAGLAKMPEE